jgi:parvulin-like peptidyl-prolyl isomerase
MRVKNPEPAQSSSSNLIGNASQLPWKTYAVAAVLLFVGILVGYYWRGHVDNPPVEVINGAAITTRDFAHQCELASGSQVLRDMTNDKMTVLLAKSLGVAPSDSDIQAKYDDTAKQTGFADQLTASGQTPDDLKQKLLIGMSKQNIIDKGVTVSQSDIQAFYADNSNLSNPNARYAQPDRVQIAAIITSNNAAHQAALHALATGASFAAVAQRISQDTSAKNGGVLPAIRRGSIDSHKYPGLENALFALSPGQQIDTYHTGNSFWIIRCVAKQAAFTTPFSQVADECKLGALLAKGLRVNGASLQSEMQSFEQSASVTVYWPQYKVVNAGH